jgi:antitoxin HicB
MAAKKRRTLIDYLAMEYPFNVIADPDGGYVIEYPDLPGCLSQADTLDEVGAMADDARRAWLTASYEDDQEIPLPSYPEEYSGKFNVRLPRSLHRRLAANAAREGVSLNHYVSTLLGTNDALRSLESRLEQIESRLADSPSESASQHLNTQCSA